MFVINLSKETILNVFVALNVFVTLNVLNALLSGKKCTKYICYKQLRDNIHSGNYSFLKKGRKRE